MKYKDKNTLRITSKHDEKVELDATSSNRQIRRILKAKMKRYKERLSKDNQYWWESLTENSKIDIVLYNYSESLDDVKYWYPGDKSIYRELKLKDVLK